jgi:orotate phosphoribosyltransferase-like protein
MSKAECRAKTLQLHNDGLKNYQIAKRLNVSDATVSRVLDQERKQVKRGGSERREG